MKFFIHSVANHQKNDGGALLVKNFFEKKSHNAEKTERGDPLGLFKIRSVGTLQKNRRGDPLGNIFFRKKVSQSQKYSKGVPFGPFEFHR